MKDFICKLCYHLYLPDTSRFCEVSILFLSFMKWKKRENLNSYLMCKKFKYEIPYGEFLCTLLYYEHHVGSVAECLGHWACNLVVPGTSPSPFHPTWWICSWCVRVFSSPLSCVRRTVHKLLPYNYGSTMCKNCESKKLFVRGRKNQLFAVRWKRRKTQYIVSLQVSASAHVIRPTNPPPGSWDFQNNLFIHNNQFVHISPKNSNWGSGNYVYMHTHIVLRIKIQQTWSIISWNS